MTPNLFKIIPTSLWTHHSKAKDIPLTKDDKSFIHFAQKEDIRKIREKFFNKVAVIVLEIDPEKVLGKLIYETNPGGTTKYYHLYEGSIPKDAILRKTFLEKEETLP